MGLTHSWGLGVLRWDFLIATPETLALETPSFPSLYQYKGPEALTPEEQESLHFLLDILAMLKGTEDPTIRAEALRSSGAQGEA